MSKILLKCPCPMPDCTKYLNTVITWIHSKDGKLVYLTDEGKIVCECGCSGMIYDWLFKCENHDYKELSSQGVLNTLTILAQASGGEESWITDIIELVMEKMKIRRKIK